MAGVSVIGFGTAQLPLHPLASVDTLVAVGVIIVGCAILAFRGWYKEQ